MANRRSRGASRPRRAARRVVRRSAVSRPRSRRAAAPRRAGAQRHTVRIVVEQHAPRPGVTAVDGLVPGMSGKLDMAAPRRARFT